MKEQTQDIKMVECPRDAMQGWKTFIDTDKKVEYLNALLQVGFDTLDFGSFVSPKAIPQMADTSEVVNQLELANSKTKLLAIIANERGAENALRYEQISYLGFPFSISETFQQRNTNASISEAVERLKSIQQMCTQAGKQLVVYISMGFGNPYGDDFNEAIVADWAKRIADLGVKIISLADTVGVATPELVYNITSAAIKVLPNVEIGVHLHSSPHNWMQKAEAALQAGCNRFDGALKGIGGCPMAKDELVGNMDTELMIPWFQQQGFLKNISIENLHQASKLASKIFV